MQQLRCTYCGGNLVDQGDWHQCDSCRTKIKKSAMERLSDQDVFDLNAARRFREGYRFQEAQVTYDGILRRNPDCEEAAWGAFLAEYGIEYQVVEQKPTFHALSAEPTYHSRYYAQLSPEHRREADEVIEEKRREILRSVETLPAYDVFLSLKFNDENGEQTPEYEWALQLYYDLREQGYQVFFSPQVLKQSNADWEPYIFRAIQTCRIMLILTSSLEHINAPWVRNEWRRLLSRIANTPEDGSKPTYRVIASDVNCVPPELLNKQLILRSDFDVKGLVEAAVQEACQAKTDSKADSASAKEKTEGDRWARGDGEPLDAYLSRIRNVAFTSDQDKKAEILSALEAERLKSPLQDMDFFVLIKRIETDSFDVSRKKLLDEQTARFLLEHGRTDPNLMQNTDYAIFKNSSLVAFYQKKWQEQGRMGSPSTDGRPRPTPVPDKKRKERHIRPLYIFLLVLILAGIAAGTYGYKRHQYLNTTEVEEDGRIRIGFEEDELVGENYESVEAMLTRAGFRRVELRALRTLTNITIKDRYAVTSVTIGGDSRYQKGNKYATDALVVISYYDVPENMVTLPFSSKSLKNSQYQNVADQFTAAGLTDIELIPVTENVTSRDMDGQVKEVSVDGQKSFSDGYVYPSTAKVKILYYSVPENMIFLPFSDADFEEVNYKDVLSSARAAGFVNIELIPLEDLITGWLTKSGEVERVSIDGNTSFSKGDSYLSDVKFTITYHVKPGEGETLPPYSPETETEDPENTVWIDFSSDDLEGENYRDVVTRLEKAGFTNVIAEPLEDLITGWMTKEGEVKGVAINGKTSFSAGESYPKDATVRVVYHAFS